MESKGLESRLNRDEDKPYGDSITKTTGDNKARLEHILKHLNQRHLRAKPTQAGIMRILSRKLDHNKVDIRIYEDMESNKSTKESDTDQHRDQEPANAECQDGTRAPRRDTGGGTATHRARNNTQGTLAGMAMRTAKG